MYYGRCRILSELSLTDYTFPGNLNYRVTRNVFKDIRESPHAHNSRQRTSLVHSGHQLTMFQMFLRKNPAFTTPCRENIYCKRKPMRFSRVSAYEGFGRCSSLVVMNYLLLITPALSPVRRHGHDIWTPPLLYL